MRKLANGAMATLNVLWRNYTRVLEKYPWRTQAANTCVLMGAGDFIAQAMVEGRKANAYDGARTLRFLGVGFIVAGPGMHWWYSGLDRFIKGNRRMMTTKKVLLDQTFFMPFYLGAFITLMALLRQEKLAEIREHLEKDYVPMLKTSYGIWPVVQVMNFYLVPPHHQVLVINFVGLIWNTYLSWRGEKNVQAIHQHQLELSQGTKKDAESWRAESRDQ